MQRDRDKADDQGALIKADGINTVGQEHSDSVALLKSGSDKSIGPFKRTSVELFKRKCFPFFSF